MKRKMINIKIDHFTLYDFDTSAINIIEKLQELIKEYGDTVFFDLYDYNDDYSSCTTFYKRLETDEEMEARYNIIKIKEQEKQEEELEELKRLQEKYNKK